MAIYRGVERLLLRSLDVAGCHSSTEELDFGPTSFQQSGPAPSQQVKRFGASLDAGKTIA
jgi:hypothetical protein